MKKVILSLMLMAGLYGLSFAQTTQSHQSGQSHSSTQQSSREKDKNEGWVKIGEKTVNLSESRGIFNWDTDREKTINANEKYSALKFKAKDATVNMTNVEVAFEDGKTQNLAISGPVRENSESKVVALQAGDKKLDKITFNYQKDENAAEDKAKIELWGLKADKTSGMGQRDDDDDKKSRRSDDPAIETR